MADALSDYDVACQMHLDALEVGDIEASISVSRALSEQGRCLAEYRRRFHAKRRELVRARLQALTDRIDRNLASMQGFDHGHELDARVEARVWPDIVALVNVLDTVVSKN